MLRFVPPLLVVGFLAAPAVAQSGVGGVVRDGTTSEPVAAASVLVADLRGQVLAAGLSDSSGFFRVAVSSADSVRVRVDRLGYRSLESEPVALHPSEPVQLQIRLRPEAIVIEGVTATARHANRNRQGFEERRRREIWGSFIGPDRMTRLRVPSASLRLSFFIPGLLIGLDGSIAIRSRQIGLDGVLTCQPTVYVDGWRMPSDLALDSYVHGSTMRAVEYYREPGQAPGQFRESTQALWQFGQGPSSRGGTRFCSVIVIWTEHGFGVADPDPTTSALPPG